jgi:uncharacterized iron-regulated membrane protein
MKVRAWLLIHRYLGMTVGALMVMWCLSGMVMLFVPFPRLTERQRLTGLPPLAWRSCCAAAAFAELDDGAPSSLQVEMLGGRPVLRGQTAGPSIRLLDLSNGATITRVTLSQAAGVASDFAARSDRAARRATATAALTSRAPPPPRLLGVVDRDQWTLSGVPETERPLYRFALGDGAETELYVSSVSGRAVQVTTARQRFWSWLGAIPHWLYFVWLRRHAALWSGVVIYAALAGCFLTASGLALGVRQLGRRPDGGRSPYRGVRRWHHRTGLVAGLLALSWVASGLLSMNPWGLLKSAGAEVERLRLAGRPPAASRVRAAVRALAGAPGLAGAVSIAFTPLAGEPYFVVETGAGDGRRLDEAGRPAPLTAAELSRIGAALGADPAAGGAALSIREDAYFFSPDGDGARLPVWRIIAGDPQRTRYYLDPISAAIEAKLDGGGRRYRWLHQALHRMDFVPAARSGPIWGGLVLLLMSGVLAVCATGLYLGLRRPDIPCSRRP